MSGREIVHLNVGGLVAPEPGSARDAMALLTDLSRRVGSSLDLTETLDAVAQAVTEALGFAVCVVNLVVEDGSVEVAVVAGPEESRAALLGQRESRESWERLLAASEDWGRLRFLDHTTAVLDPTDVLTWVPDIPISDDPDAWHPEDALFAPLHASDGRLLGVLSVDVPFDGKRVGEAARQTLAAFAVQAELAIERAAVHSRLRSSEGLFRTVVNASPIPICLMDIDHRIVEANEAFCRFLGRPLAELVGTDPDALTHPEDVEEGPRLQVMLRTGESAGTGERRYLRPDGSVVWGRLHLALLPETHNKVCVVAHIEDLTEAHGRETRLRHDASHDPLTGLPNRAVVLERLGEVAARATERRSADSVCVLYCDLDHFKDVNDTYGHAVGDVLLAEVGHRLRDALRACDSVGRIGGDEFVVIGEGIGTPTEAVGLAGRLADAAALPVRVGDIEISPSISIGVALSGPHDTAETLLHKADTALYAAKAAGRQRWHLYGTEDRGGVWDRPPVPGIEPGS